MKIATLAGGVGGAKLADGLYRALPPGALSVIVNIGDDFDHLGLRICPDLDTVCYTLAGLANPETGWGLAGDSFRAMASLEKLGGPGWFRIGDNDLGTHLERTRRLGEGECLTDITADFCQRWNINAKVIPVTNDRVSTLVHTHQGAMAFQEYFVHQQCEPEVTGFTYEKIEHARASEEALRALEEAGAVVICPSNPWVSIGPILAFKEIRNLLENKLVVAVSPIVGGKALRGPAAKMYAELGWEASALSVSRHYGSLLNGFILDEQDAHTARFIEQSGIISLITNTVMRSAEDRLQLANRILDFLESIDRRLLPG